MIRHEKHQTESHRRWSFLALAGLVLLAHVGASSSEAWCNRWGCGTYQKKTAQSGVNYGRVTVCYYSGGCVQVRRNQSTGAIVKRGKR